MRQRTALLGVAAAILASGAAAVVSAPAYAAAPPGCGFGYTPPVLISSSGHPSWVEVDGEIVCDDPNNPNDGRPILVTLQQLHTTGWVTVSHGTGTANFSCTGVQPKQYRALQLPSVVETLACS